SVSVLLGNGDGTFRSFGMPLPTGSAPRAVVVADLNGDAIPDLVVANGGDNSVSVRLGNGDGTFGPQRTYSVGRSPSAVAVADIDGDRVLDIVTVNRTDNDVSVLLGNPRASASVQSGPLTGAAILSRGDGSFRP